MNRWAPGRYGRMGDVNTVAPSVVGAAPSGVLPPLPPVGSMPMSPEEAFFDPARDGVDVMFYATPIVATLANAASTNQVIQIDSGVDFYWFASTYYVDVGSSQTESSIVYPSVSIVMNDTGSRKNLQNTAFAIGSVAGPGERPYRLPRPRLFRASSTINFTFNNFGGTSYSNLQFIMHGYTKPRGT